MKNLSLVILILFVISSKNIESQNKDSILVVLKSLNKKAFFLKNNPDSLNFYTDKILKISEEYNIPLYKVKVYGLLGLVNKNNNQFEKSMYFLHKAKNLSKKLNLENEYYRNLNDIARVHSRTSYHDSAIYYYKKIDKYYSVNNTDLLPMNRIHLASSYSSIGKLDSAIINYQLANKELRLLKGKSTRLPLNRLITGNLVSIVNNFYDKNEYEISLKYADTTLILAKKYKLYHLLPSIYNKQSQSYYKLGNFLKSDKYSELQVLSDTIKLNLKKDIIKPTTNPKKIVEYENDRKRRIRKEVEDKLFYKSGLFKSAIVVLILAILAFYFFRGKTKFKKEVLTIQKKLDKLKAKNNFVVEKIITLKSKAIINTKEILFIKSDGHYVEYFLDSKQNPEVDRNSLKEVTKILPPESFIRIHKSYIVNIHRIKIINATKVMLDNGVWINLSRTYKQQLKDILHKED